LTFISTYILDNGVFTLLLVFVQHEGAASVSIMAAVYMQTAMGWAFWLYFCSHYRCEGATENLMSTKRLFTSALDIAQILTVIDLIWAWVSETVLYKKRNETMSSVEFQARRLLRVGCVAEKRAEGLGFMESEA
jgi:hypothetical protein